MTNQTHTPRHLHARDMKTQLRVTANVTMAGKFECNPFSQYGWLEDALGLPITSALTDLLESGARP
jgi:hypothetical protein